MTSTPPEETRPGPSGQAEERPVEVRVLLPGDIVRRVDVNRALVGQTRQAFVQLALQRHLELYSHLMLDLTPGGKGGVGIVVAGKDVPRRALPRRSGAPADSGASSAGAGAAPDAPADEAGGEPPDGGGGG